MGKTRHLFKRIRDTKVTFHAKMGIIKDRNSMDLTEGEDIKKKKKKTFLSEQCKETEENNRIRNTRDLFKQTKDTKGTFCAKMVIVKDGNSKDLTEAEEIKKRWQEYTEELYKKHLNDLDNHCGGVTRLEPDILKCEVKWVLGSITRNKR